MNRQGILIVVSGFSGAGKGTIMNGLVERHEQYALSVSVTTRAPRPGEQEGVSYFFRTVPEFERMIADGELIEYARYVDHYYGTPKAWVKERLAEGKDVILEIEIQGARQVKKLFPEAVLLFVTTKDAQTLNDRLRGRGTETPEVIRQRLKRAVEESEGVGEYDYLIVNDDLEDCIREVHGIIEGEHRRIERNTDRIDRIRQELRELLKGE